MIEKFRCIDANAKHLAIISNSILRLSKTLTEQAYAKGYISSQKPRFTSESIKKFYNIEGFYEKNGKIKESAKSNLERYLKELGLKTDTTLGEFKNIS